MALQTYDSLYRFECKASDDDVKSDLELTCADCGAVVCDVEAGDTLDVLARTASDHNCPDEDGTRPCGCPEEYHLADCPLRFPGSDE